MRYPVLSTIPFALGAFLPAPVDAQRVAEPVATFPEPFSQVVGLQELSDGRLIIADRLEKHVSYIDFAGGTLRQIGAEGEGPGEYQQPLGLTPFLDDGTLLSDLGNMRISLIESNGRINKSWPMMRQSPSGGMSFIRPSAADHQGMIYFATTGMLISRGAGAQPTPTDSAFLLRFNLETDKVDTVATLFSEPLNPDGQQTVTIRGGSARLSSMANRPFRVQDGWGVAPDGRIAIVRATDYRVDWVNTDGTVAAGGPNEYDRVRIRQAEKEAWANRNSGGGSVVALDGGGGSGNRSSTFTIEPADIDEVEFPDFMPPFGTNAVAISPSGHVWVRLNQSAEDKEPLFEVFDGNGTRIHRVRLGEGRRLVGFGNGTFYAVNVDEDDLQWLERYAYPPGR